MDEDLGLAPGLAIIEAPTQDNVDILWNVGLIVLPSVGEGEEYSALCLVNHGDAVVATTTITGDEKWLIGSKESAEGLVAHLLQLQCYSIERRLFYPTA
ncbi:Uncharacterised protein [Chlamydia trachomatis]|nr:Uncharacterised protein [Chlamydia trachomatis]